MSTRGALLETLLNNNFKKIRYCHYCNKFDISFLITKSEIKDVLYIIIFDNNDLIIDSYKSKINNVYNIVYEDPNITYTNIIYNNSAEVEIHTNINF